MSSPLRLVSQPAPPAIPAERLALLKEIEKKVLWLSAWTIHHANHIRKSTDGLKVGGHQASCASATTLLTALYMDVMRPQDRIAVKPHASPVFHAIMYMLGRPVRAKMENFRGFGGGLGRANVGTPVTNAPLVCRLSIEQ